MRLCRNIRYKKRWSPYNGGTIDETKMTQEERTSVCDNIKKRLFDGYEKDFFNECIKNLSNNDSRIRLSNFAYALRELVREVLADRAPDERVRNRTIDEIDSLATHHNIDVYNLGETKVVDIDDECIYFHASGTVIVHLQFGSNADLRNDMGHEMDVAYPFNAVFASSIPQDLDDIMLSVVDFEVDTDENFDLEKEIEAFLKENKIA